MLAKRQQNCAADHQPEFHVRDCADGQINADCGSKERHRKQDCKRRRHVDEEVRPAAVEVSAVSKEGETRYINARVASHINQSKKAMPVSPLILTSFLRFRYIQPCTAVVCNGKKLVHGGVRKRNSAVAQPGSRKNLQERLSENE